MTRQFAVTALFALVLASSNVLAAGSSSGSKKSSAYDKAVEAVDSGDYQGALDLLDKVVASDDDNADAWNYIGFSNRKLSRYDAALAAYEKALAINPKHRGALEYLGELYLKMGDVAKAEQQIEKLDKACFFGCEELTDLKEAIAKHKSG